jgi:hypothetical protein
MASECPVTQCARDGHSATTIPPRPPKVKSLCGIGDRIPTRLVLVGFLLAQCASAQRTTAELTDVVKRAWSTGSVSEFAALLPFAEGEIARVAGATTSGVTVAKVVRERADKAVLVLASAPTLSNSGDATWAGSAVSGVYEAALQSNRWVLVSRTPLSELGRIIRHTMRVSVEPGSGLLVDDRMRIAANGSRGFAVRLNHSAKLMEVRSAGRSVAHLFGGGLLWVDLAKSSTELHLKYALQVDKNPAESNSGSFLANAGHVRGQYYWHPLFDFDESADRAEFLIEARIPRDYRICISVPQRERLDGAERIVVGRTTAPTTALTLLYDRDWKADTYRLGDIRLRSFVTPEFTPDLASSVEEFGNVYRLLSERFGALLAREFAIVEARSFKDNPGWRFSSNTIAVAAGTPRFTSLNSPAPMAPLGHEIAHFWTNGSSGPAFHFLTEGWAVYAESLIIANKYGDEAVANFWKLQTDMYFSAFDGKTSLAADRFNTGVSYSKGAWTFRMLEAAIGTGGFRQTIAEYSRSDPASGVGWERLAAIGQRHAPPDLDVKSFLQPWITQTVVPSVTTIVEGSVVRIIQQPSDFRLPLEIHAWTSRGEEHHTVWTQGRETVVHFSGEVSRVELDPHRLLLIHR